MILNYKYGLFAPKDWDATCEREVALQDALWNRLVSLEAAYRKEVEATIRQETDYRLSAERIEDVNRRLDEVLAERRAQRKAARSKIATPALDEEISRLTGERRELWAANKPLRAAAFRAHKEELKDLSDVRYQNITLARQNSDLWWGNYNAVVASFDATLRRLQPWQQPRPLEGARLSGRLTIQIQRGCPGPAFLNGGRSEADIELEEGQWRRRGSHNWHTRHGTLTATVHAAGRGNRKTASWPILMHRPLPTGAVVKSLIITRRRPVPTARSWKWEVCVTIDLPEPEASYHGTVAGIDLGWRKVEGGVRVATIADSVGGLDHLILPAEMLERRVRIAGLQGRVEQESREAGKDKLTHPDWRRLSLEVARWNRRRRDLYRVAAIDLVRRCHLIGIDATGIATMAQDRSMPPETRRMRTWAAPAEFASAVRDAGRRAGIRVSDVEGASTLVCHRCQHKNEVSDADRQDLIWRCQSCGDLWDQDQNAALNCLDAVLRVSSAEVAIKPAAERRRPPRLTRRKEATRAPPGNEAT